MPRFGGGDFRKFASVSKIPVAGTAGIETPERVHRATARSVQLFNFPPHSYL
jgi:hypothetical protein